MVGGGGRGEGGGFRAFFWVFDGGSGLKGGCCRWNGGVLEKAFEQIAS